jgi:hypothetical protein
MRNPWAGSSKPLAGRMHGVSSTRSISRMPLRPLLRRSSASPLSTPSKPRSEAARRRSGRRSDKLGHGRYWTVCIPGLKPLSRSSPASPTRQRRSATPSRAGGRSYATSTTATSRSTTTPPNAPCASSPWDAKTISSPDPTPEENAPQPSTRCLAQPSSTTSTRRSISTT